MRVVKDARPQAALFDLDGVLASNDHIMHLIKATPPDWQAFQQEYPLCAPIPAYLTLATLLQSAGLHIVILTNRGERHREVTEDWLRLQGITYEALFMREPGVPYIGAKERKLAELFPWWHFRLAVDDDPEQCAMYQRHGIPALYAHSGYYEGELIAGIEATDSHA